MANVQEEGIHKEDVRRHVVSLKAKAVLAAKTVL